jgi:hypothetical protein
MNRKNNRVLSWGIICLFLAWLFQSGCTVAKALKGEPGKDVSSIKSGITKQEAEEILGSPIREWTTPLNIRYYVYSYDAGIPPNLGDAAAFAFLDIIGAGVLELYEVIGLTGLGKTWDRTSRVVENVAISYDANDAIVGVFDHLGDFDVLPDNGRAEK